MYVWLKALQVFGVVLRSPSSQNFGFEVIPVFECVLVRSTAGLFCDGAMDPAWAGPSFVCCIFSV